MTADHVNRSDNGWICAYADDKLRPCHKPALWFVEIGQLGLAACSNVHRDALIDAHLPRVRYRFLGPDNAAYEAGFRAGAEQNNPPARVERSSA